MLPIFTAAKVTNFCHFEKIIYLCSPPEKTGTQHKVLTIKNQQTVDTLSYKTKSVNKENSSKEWVLIDANDQVLGRLASRVAILLRGKNKPNFTPNADCGDNVIIINADKVRLTGKKMTDKVYVRHTGYPGGQRFATPKELFSRKPLAVLEHAVRGMLPRTRLGEQQFKNLHLYVGSEHPHQAQNPKTITLNEI